MDRSVSIPVAFLVGLSVFGSFFVASRAYVRGVEMREEVGTISVRGSARRRIRSDLIVWRAHVTAEAPDLGTAYHTLARSMPKVRAFLVQRGIPEGQITTSSVAIRPLHPRSEQGFELEEQTIGYVLEQAIEVASNDIERVTRASRDVTQLIDQGVSVQSEAPRYIYTRLAELKVQLIAEAAQDARQRAAGVARRNHQSLGRIRNARVGVIQINPANETEVSAEGVNDTSSLEKDALSVISVVYTVD